MVVEGVQELKAVTGRDGDGGDGGPVGGYVGAGRVFERGVADC